MFDKTIQKVFAKKSISLLLVNFIFAVSHLKRHQAFETSDAIPAITKSLLKVYLLLLFLCFISS